MRAPTLRHVRARCILRWPTPPARRQAILHNDRASSRVRADPLWSPTVSTLQPWHIIVLLVVVGIPAAVVALALGLSRRR